VLDTALASVGSMRFHLEYRPPAEQESKAESLSLWHLKRSILGTGNGDQLRRQSRGLQGKGLGHRGTSLMVIANRAAMELIGGDAGSSRDWSDFLAVESYVDSATTKNICAFFEAQASDILRLYDSWIIARITLFRT
jgi:hypothetical protein